MTKREAAAILGFKSEDVPLDTVFDEYEQRVFSLTRPFVNRRIDARLIPGRLKKFRLLHKAYQILAETELPEWQPDFAELNIHSCNSLPVLVSEFIRIHNQPRLALANSVNAPACIAALEHLQHLCIAYARHYVKLYEQHHEPSEALIQQKMPPPEWEELSKSTTHKLDNVSAGEIEYHHQKLLISTLSAS